MFNLYNEHPKIADPRQHREDFARKIVPEASLRQILNEYFVRNYNLHSLEANDYVDEYISDLERIKNEHTGN